MFLKFAQFLNQVFPSLATAQISDCWVSTVVKAGLQPVFPVFEVISEAIEVVERHGQIEQLKGRLRQEHPLDREHNPQYDLRLRDCFTEACALAWAARVGLSNPRWVLGKGMPDLQTDQCWIEAKTMHASDEDRALTERLLKGRIESGPIPLPKGGLKRKFQSDLDDAVRKFDRVEADRRVVFFNLEQLDLWATPFEAALMQDLSNLARSASSRGVEVVICRSYDWQNPI